MRLHDIIMKMHDAVLQAKSEGDELTAKAIQRKIDYLLRWN